MKTSKEFSVMELNGILTDCIIDNTENVYEQKILDLLEKIASDFNDKIVEILDKE